MSAQRKLSKVAQAYERCQLARSELAKIARCMETTEDKQYGILWERWCIIGETDCVSVVLYATPDMWDVFAPVTRENDTAATIAAIKALA